METWMSWALFLAIAGAAYFYYNQKSPVATRGRPTTRASVTSNKDASSWADAEVAPKTSKKATKAKQPRKTVTEAVQEVGTKAEEYLSAASTEAAKVVEKLPSAPTSTTATNKSPSGKDVSDMLEEPIVAPTILSIKPSDKPSRPSKPKAQKVETPQETKKQRQNKKKNEEAKAAREDDEKQRQILLEKQRRTAREARGEPAKNGLQAASAPTSNAWTAVPSRGAVQPPVPAPSVQLLDTFDAPSTSEKPVNGSAPPAASVGMTEEEQVKLAIEDSAWSTVPKGGKKQRKAKGDEVLEEGTNSGAVDAPAPVKPVRPTQALTDKKPSSRYQILSEDFTPNTNDDSDWPVV